MLTLAAALFLGVAASNFVSGQWIEGLLSLGASLAFVVVRMVRR